MLRISPTTVHLWHGKTIINYDLKRAHERARSGAPRSGVACTGGLGSANTESISMLGQIGNDQSKNEIWKCPK